MITQNSVLYRGFYSKTKRLCILVSALILSSVLILPMLVSPNLRISIKQGSDLIKKAIKKEMISPVFYSSDQNNMLYMIKSDRAVEENKDSILLDNLEVTLQKSGEYSMNLFSPSGFVSRGKKLLRIFNGVYLKSSSGYELTTSAIDIDMGSNLAKGQDDVELKGPLFTIKASSFTMGENKIEFRGTVKTTIKAK